jgi:hypothetical protein
MPSNSKSECVVLTVFKRTSIRRIPLWSPLTEASSSCLVKARSVASRSVGIVAGSACGFCGPWRLEEKETRHTKRINFA